MVVLKGLLGAVIGYFAGGLGGLVVAGIVWFVVVVSAGSDKAGAGVFNTVLGLCALIGAGVGFALPFKADSDRQKTDADRKRAEADRLETSAIAQQQRLKETQWQYRQQMIVLGTQSLDLFESMPEHLGTAEEHLDQAEIDLAEGAIAPFWDSIERATEKLCRFDEGVRQINGNVSNYTKLVDVYGEKAPAFPLARQAIAKLNVGALTTERMKAIVRKAQRDPQRNWQFAMIYEQRKTNRILVSGFTNLAQALDQMTWHITTSIGDLTSSVDAVASKVSESVRAIDSRIGDFAKATALQNEARSKETAEGAQREMKVIAMLENIQRKRKPKF